MDPIRAWLKKKKWRAFPYQEETWEALAAGQSGLVHAPTGVGKTYAIWLGVLQRWLTENPEPQSSPKKEDRFTLLWITPLRALANDTVKSLLLPVEDLKLPWSVELRTGDTTSAVRARQKIRLPTALVTTPESLSLLLSFPDTREKFAGLRYVVVDEWHELLASKRGVQTELCLARLRQWNPALQAWGLSATIGNLKEGLDVLMGSKPTSPGRLIAGEHEKKVVIRTLFPKSIERFPWSGHLGLHLLPQVIKLLEKRQPTLIFTNTRSQTELWFRALQDARPDWAEEIGIHHGSIERDRREEVEKRLSAGNIRCVVCTSSLDLGVDFSPVEQVVQVGAPKGVARVIQRAGRSGHRPGATSTLLCAPAHAFELVEFAAVREAIERRELEVREPLDRPLDVLVQHVVTLALGGGFNADHLLGEVRQSFAYRNLTEQEWGWILDFVRHGGGTLQAYPQFSRVQKVGELHTVSSREIAYFHRMSIGTITSDSSVVVKYVRGGSLGSVEESFITRLRPGDRFSFAGQQLELVRVRDMTAFVRRAKRSGGATPTWMGSRIALSGPLARSVRRKLDEAREGKYLGPEMEAVRPVLELQAQWSKIPAPDELLIEKTKMKEGFQFFAYPFAGRLVHEGLSTLLAFRFAQERPRSIVVTASDYGFTLISTVDIPLEEELWKRAFSDERLIEDLFASMNAAEMARRQFREIARIAGLIFPGYPGSHKSGRQLQASSSLFYEVFQKYDPENLLLIQARKEVLEQQLEVSRMKRTLEEIGRMKFVFQETQRLSPLAFPLWASWVQGQVSTEKWSDRIQRMALQLEKEAGK